MGDLEITKKCAEASGLEFQRSESGELAICDGHPRYQLKNRLAYYDPIHDDAQAMALVKKFRLHCYIRGLADEWCASPNGNPNVFGASPALNRAICECVAKMERP